MPWPKCWQISPLRSRKRRSRELQVPADQLELPKHEVLSPEAYNEDPAAGTSKALENPLYSIYDLGGDSGVSEM